MPQDMSENSSEKPSRSTDSNESETPTSDRSQCNRKKVQRGTTSIYILENNVECRESIQNSLQSGADDVGASFDSNMNTADESKESECADKAQNIKRFVNNDEIEDETVIIVRKRGNKISIEF